MEPNDRHRDRGEEREGPERIERLPGEMESAMYSGSDEGEPAPGPEELGPLPDREEALRAFQRMDELAGEPEAEESRPG